MQHSIPINHDVVLVGGGHTHALVLRSWGMKPLPGTRLTLVNPAPDAPYTGMLPGYVAGHYSHAELHMDLVRLARFAGARIILDHACDIDPVSRTLALSNRPPIAYDTLSINVGITSNLPQIEGFAEHAVGAKPLGTFADAWTAFLKRTEAKAETKRVVVIGGGVAGVELSMAMAHRLQTDSQTDITVELVEAGDKPLKEIGSSARSKLLSHTQRLGVKVHTNARAEQVTQDAVILSDGRHIASDFTVGAAGAQPHHWLVDHPLTDARGFLPVGPTLQVNGHPNIFAAGDCAELTHAPRKKAGVFAVREAPILFDNLRSTSNGDRLSPFHPQRDYLKLVSTGGKNAVADKYGFALDGAWLWTLKDRIDRKFMDQFDTLPSMAGDASTEIPDHPPLCTGCGAKVESDALKAALENLPPAARPEILSSPGDDAAVFAANDKSNTPSQVITTDHLSALVDDPFLMAQIAAVHALGDIWAMGARPQAALATLIIPRMTAALQQRMLTEILQGAKEIFDPEETAIVGGHSTMGADFTIGFTLTGLPRDNTLWLSAARPGDRLVLTKPIGSGVLARAHMLDKANGRWMRTLWQYMVRTQGAAARILASSANAVTDVTGFGLAGHLARMNEASKTGALLVSSSIPVLTGAMECAEQRIRSTLWEANRKSAGPIEGLQQTPRHDLLFDPQTCGGLLAAVPAKAVSDVISPIVDSGLLAVEIGEVTDQTGVITLTN